MAKKRFLLIRDWLPVRLYRYKLRWKRALKSRKKIGNYEYVVSQYKKKLKRDINLENPERYTEKIQWVKLFYNDPLYSVCSDKYAVRHYLERKGYGRLLNDLIGVYTDSNQIDLDSLPDKFVIKATHGSKWNLICSDKDKIRKQWRWWKKILNNWLLQDYGLYSREPHYSRIRPKLICERFLENSDGSEAIDYKFFCFNGEPYYNLLVTHTPFYSKSYVDVNWNRCNFSSGDSPEIEKLPEKPDNLEEMLGICRDLSKDFPFVRLDLYVVDGKIYFGEFTFTSLSGFITFRPDDTDRKIGNLITMPSDDSPYVLK